MMNAHGNTNDVDELHKGIGTFEMTSEYLPSGWTKSKLINLAHLQRGFDLPVNDRVDGSYPVLASNGQIGWHNEFKVKGPGVITGRSGSIGKVHFVESDYWPLNTSLFVKNFHTNHPKYVYYFLQSMNLAQYHEGTGVPTLNRNVIHDLPILIPPLPEQQRIAALLEKVDHLRRLRRQSLKRLDDLVQATFLEMFGDPVMSIHNWPKVAFGEVCNSRLGKMLDQKQQTGENKRLYLRNANVQWSKFDLSEVFEMDFNEKDRKEFLLMPGDILICEGGEPGRAAIWKGEISECYYQKALHRVRLNNKLITGEYLVWLLWFLSKRGLLSDHVTAATIAHLTGEKLKAMLIPLPPKSLQDSFSHKLLSIEKTKSSYQNSFTKLDTLFNTLMHQAFNGELNWKEAEQAVAAGQLELPLGV